MKKLVILLLFSLAGYCQENEISAIDYYLLHKERKPFVTSEMVRPDTIKDINMSNDPNQKQINELKSQIYDLNKQLSDIKAKEYEKGRDIFAGCVTTIPYLDMDIQSVESLLYQYLISIETIKNRNLMQNDEFKKWFNLYGEFIQKQSDLKIDLTQLFKLNTSNVVDFVLSSISNILSNRSSSKELRKSSQLMFNIISSENAFYKDFEEKVEIKYNYLNTNFVNLKKEIQNYKMNKIEIIPEKLTFNTMENSNLAININTYYFDTIKTNEGLKKMREDKIRFYEILENYLALKKGLKDLNKAFAEISNTQIPVQANNVNVIESQLNSVQFLIYGL